MSDPITQRRPALDLSEFEKCLRQLPATNENDSGSFAELLRVLRGQESPGAVHTPLSVPDLAARKQQAGEAGEEKKPDASERNITSERNLIRDFAAEAGLPGGKQLQVKLLPAPESTPVGNRKSEPAPIIAGDFAAIEAGLLGVLRDQVTVTTSASADSSSAPGGKLEAERWFQDDLQDDHGAASAAGVAGQARSRRPLFAAVAIAIAGAAGIVAIYGIKGGASGVTQVATIPAESGSTKLQAEMPADVVAPAQDAAVLPQRPEPSPVALTGDSEKPSDLPQEAEKTPPAAALMAAQAPSDSGAAIRPTLPAQAQTPAEPVSVAAPKEPEPVPSVDVAPVRPPQTDLVGTPPLAAAPPCSGQGAPGQNSNTHREDAKARPGGGSAPS